MNLHSKYRKQWVAVISVSLVLCSSWALAQGNVTPVFKNIDRVQGGQMTDIDNIEKKSLSANFQDMNQDGLADVIVLDEKNRTISVFVSNGDGSLQDPSSGLDRSFALPSNGVTGVDAGLDAEGVFTVNDDQQVPSCDKNTAGLVALNISGNPGDSFRNTLKCGGKVVAVCYATIAKGKTTADCKKGPVPAPKGGLKTCSIGEGNSNSNKAKVTASFCG